MTYLLAHGGIVAQRLGEHVVLVAIALAIALPIALPLGVLAARRPRLGAAILATTGALYTIPSLALLALLVVVLGIGPLSAIVALVVYAQLGLVRGVVAGLRGVDPALVEAARGLGLTARQTLLRVEFPSGAKLLYSGGMLAEAAQGAAEIGPGQKVLGIEVHGFLKMHQSVGQFAVGGQQGRQGVLGRSKRRIGSDG